MQTKVRKNWNEMIFEGLVKYCLRGEETILDGFYRLDNIIAYIQLIENSEIKILIDVLGDIDSSPFFDNPPEYLYKAKDDEPIRLWDSHLGHNTEHIFLHGSLGSCNYGYIELGVKWESIESFVECIYLRF